MEDFECECVVFFYGNKRNGGGGGESLGGNVLKTGWLKMEIEINMVYN